MGLESNEPEKTPTITHPDVLASAKIGEDWIPRARSECDFCDFPPLRLHPAGIGLRRRPVERVDEGDRALGDHLPMLPVEGIEQPGADRAAQQPEKDRHADVGFHHRPRLEEAHAITDRQPRQCQRFADAGDSALW